jgi:hypothetical protein
MWSDMRDWLRDPLPVQIPAESALQADLTGPTYGYDSNNRLKLEDKEKMKKRGLHSPDAGDALSLTFAATLAPRDTAQPGRYRDPHRRQRRGSWVTV